MKFASKFLNIKLPSCLPILILLISFNLSLNLQFKTLNLNQATLGNVFDFLQLSSKGHLGGGARIQEAPPKEGEPKKEEPKKEEAKEGDKKAPTDAKDGAASSDLIVDLLKPSGLLEDWMTISSASFANKDRYPDLYLPNRNLVQVNQGEGQRRLNENYGEALKSGAKNQYEFYTKMKSKYIFYFNKKEDLNILDSIYVSNVQDLNDSENCFKIESQTKESYVLCGRDHTVKLRWLCSIQSLFKYPLTPECPQPKNENPKVPTGNVVVRKNLKKMIIIPTPSPHCNEIWNYANKGADWQCICKEGTKQSPINLPIVEKTEPIETSPYFNYYLLKKGTNEESYTRIIYDKNGGVLRIVSSQDFGKIVLEDGSQYKAQEIYIHTPSEHTINGKQYEMELQIVHYGVTQGDIDKQISLSFLFKSKPGKLNKFFEKLDYYNLPNPMDTSKIITDDFFIPYILDSEDDSDSLSMKSFSFYQYDGSLTVPPCTERTTVLVASEPIELSTTTITLFKEALKLPDTVDSDGQIYLGESGEKSTNRVVQPLNERTVQYFNHVKYGCPDFVQKKKMPKKLGGHYEKRKVRSAQYFYVKGNKPSGIPGAVVIPENEAKERGLEMMKTN